MPDSAILWHGVIHNVLSWWNWYAGSVKEIKCYIYQNSRGINKNKARVCCCHGYIFLVVWGKYQPSPGRRKWNSYDANYKAAWPSADPRYKKPVLMNGMLLCVLFKSAQLGGGVCPSISPYTSFPKPMNIFSLQIRYEILTPNVVATLSQRTNRSVRETYLHFCVVMNAWKHIAVRLSAPSWRVN